MQNSTIRLLLVAALTLNTSTASAGEPKRVITIEDARNDLGLEPDENLDLPVQQLPLPDNGVCVDTRVAREWLIAARKYATDTGIPRAEEFNRGIKERFAPLISALIIEPGPVTMTAAQIQRRVNQIETFRQAGMTRRLSYVVHWAVYDGIGAQISADPEHWSGLKDLYDDAAPFKGIKQLWVDSLMTLRTLQYKLKALKPIEGPRKL